MPRTSTWPVTTSEISRVRYVGNGQTIPKSIGPNSPLVDFIFLELPWSAHEMGKHPMLVNPLVHGVIAEVEVFAYLHD